MASRVLMISTNRERAPQPVMPVGAAWVAEALHQAGFVVRFVDLCFERQPLKRLDEAIRTFKPDGIAVSVRNLDNCDFLSPKSFLPEVRTLTEYIKSRTSAPVLLGGSGVSVMPGQVLEYLDLQYAIAGEGEAAAVSFFRSASPDRGPRIPGLVLKGESPVVPHADQTVPVAVMPQMHRWIDIRRYLRYEPVIPVQGKRGCAKRCLYCTYGSIEGERWRVRPHTAVIEEIAAAITATGAREFEFVDSVFNEPQGYLESLLEEIIRSGVKARFHVSSLSPGGLTKEQVRLMERAGVASVVITPEAASDVTLAALAKDYAAEDVVRAAQLLAGSNIKGLWCFLLGGPKEDVRTLGETLDFINRKIGRKDAAFLTTGIRIYPHTGLHALAVKEGMLPGDHNLLMPIFYFSPALMLRETLELLRKDLAHPDRCIFLSDTRKSPIGVLRRLGTTLGLPTPFWRFAGYMNRITGGSRVIG